MAMSGVFWGALETLFGMMQDLCLAIEYTARPCAGAHGARKDCESWARCRCLVLGVPPARAGRAQEQQAQ
nr:hypothetical protein FFPRI1PSEUD_45190 [Pseudomonas sp. FFPRI_1]